MEVKSGGTKRKIRFSADINGGERTTGATSSPRDGHTPGTRNKNAPGWGKYSAEEELLLLWQWGPTLEHQQMAMAAQRPPYKDDDAVSVHTVYEDFDPARHNPVFYGKMHKKIESVDCDPDKECDPSTCHPSLAGYTLLDKPPKSPTPPPPALPDVKKCLPRVYLDTYIFPVLLPALEEMLRQAKLEKCFERKRTKFNGLDFLTEYLYGHNSSHADREETPLGEIPFVKEHWKDHPRPPLPKSLIWTEAEAVLILQSFWRGYKVRCDPQIQELRQWQREWREENANIQNKVSDFWAKKMPDGDEAEEEEEEEIDVSPRDGENNISPREGENQSQDVGETEETSNPGQDVEEA